MKKEVKFWLCANPLTGSSWWAVLLMGILYLAAGVIVLMHPVASLLVIMYIVGVFLLVGGLWRILMPLARKKNVGGWEIVSALLMLIIGVLIMMNTFIAEWALTIFVGIWILFSGFDTLFAGLGAPAGTPGRGLVIFDGIISILCGILVALPLYGMFTLGYLVGIYLVIFGVFAISGATMLHQVCRNGKCRLEEKEAE